MTPTLNELHCGSRAIGVALQVELKLVAGLSIIEGAQAQIVKINSLRGVGAGVVDVKREGLNGRGAWRSSRDTGIQENPFADGSQTVHLVRSPGSRGVAATGSLNRSKIIAKSIKKRHLNDTESRRPLELGGCFTKPGQLPPRAWGGRKLLVAAGHGSN